jgi:MFS family permease
MEFLRCKLRHDINNASLWDLTDKCQASFLNSLEMGVEFFALIVVLPFLTRYAPHRVRGLQLFKKEKLLAQGSIAALAIGTLCLGIAPAVLIAIAGKCFPALCICRDVLILPGITILALGTGQDSLLRSMTTELVDPSEISIVYSAITMLRAIGGSISGPIYAELYVVGMDHKNEGWLGLPFLFAGILFIVVLGLLAVLADPGEKGYEAIPETQHENNE